MTRRPTPVGKPEQTGKSATISAASVAERVATPTTADDPLVEATAKVRRRKTEPAAPPPSPAEPALDGLVTAVSPVPTPEPEPRVPAGVLAPAASRNRRLLVATHSHPALSKGGAEITAWKMFESFREEPGWKSWFLGCGREVSTGRLGSVITQPFGDDQFLYASNQFNWFKFSNHDERFPREFATLLSNTRPDILHFHHYLNFGVETFLIARRTLPDVKIVLTLHEFQAICNHFGQMVTKQRKSLCYKSSPRDCNKCFPDIRPADFFLRQSYIQRFMDLVDHFISPSQFLADRYADWGIPAEKISVIENVIAEAVPVADDAMLGRKGPLRVGFFGQISFLKGIHVLLEAARVLESDDCTDVVFDIYGDYSNQPEEFQKDFLERLEKAGTNVRFHGPYENVRVDQLMCGCDVVLLPSIWWENSPVVIQECLRNRRPILCSNIGGMAEKVRPGQDGWHFNVGNAIELAMILEDLAADRTQIDDMKERMRMPPPPADSMAAHLAVYDRLLQA